MHYSDLLQIGVCKTDSYTGIGTHFILKDSCLSSLLSPQIRMLWDFLSDWLLNTNGEKNLTTVQLQSELGHAFWHRVKHYNKCECSKTCQNCSQ